MSHTLIVYQNINYDEEPTSFYLVPNECITETMRGFLRQAHNNLINCDDTNDGMAFLNAAIATDKAHVDLAWAHCAHIFLEYKMNMNEPWFNPELGIDHVYVSGFVC